MRKAERARRRQATQIADILGIGTRSGRSRRETNLRPDHLVGRGSRERDSREGRVFVPLPSQLLPPPTLCQTTSPFLSRSPFTSLNFESLFSLQVNPHLSLTLSFTTTTLPLPPPPLSHPPLSCSPSLTFSPSSRSLSSCFCPSIPHEIEEKIVTAITLQMTRATNGATKPRTQWRG